MKNFPWEKWKVDAVLFSSPENIGVFAGFWGSFGRLLVGKNFQPLLISDGRYSLFAQKLCQKNGIEYREISSDTDFWNTFLQEKKVQKLGVESSHLSWAALENFKKNLEKIEIFPLHTELQTVRAEKTAEEIFFLKKAAEIGDTALQKTIAQLQLGQTEQEVAWIFEKTAREILGADELSFPTIVAFGENSAVAHHTPTEKKLEKNMPILIDCGVKKNQYCSDLTRCFFVGNDQNPLFEEWKKMYDLVDLAQNAGILEMLAGKKIADADAAARKIFGEYESFYIHSFGHGVGVAIHEFPNVSVRNTNEIFSENMVVTAEPGLYFPEKFGIRMEDLLKIGKEKAEKLSQFPHDKFLISR